MNTKQINIKQIESCFYDKWAQAQKNYVSWQDKYPEYLKSPYKKYLSLLQSLEVKNPKILDLGCGMGEFSFDIARIRSDGEVLAVDISPESIAICNRHLEETNQKNLQFKIADVEELKLSDNEFDIICMSGTLSCLNLSAFLRNIKKWLKPEGYIILVDTYGYSPIFNLKRKFNYLLGKRTLQTLKSIPQDDTINQIKACFNQTEISFYGTFAFIGPFLKYIIGDKRTAKVVDFLDKIFPILNKWAFKFVLVARGVKNESKILCAK